ncbi:hypothetical protein EST38_g2758 [Candolleomyces aberdarensis]|uniref:Nephrocystin 3-like N-terminal domain-containing protein n=1 Tax=Candolleomyces aberdarensis TaxID=2316362 RepID=A0A4Q2DVW2_9AGAR|nr:hypothetical protein EST38_g2758 [Candolleomyces aberdarensis]
MADGAPGPSFQYFSNARDVHFSGPTAFYNVGGSILSNHGYHRPVAELHAVLNPISEAIHTRDRKTSPPDAVCMDGTRRELIQNITDWADSEVQPNNHIYILAGYVGSGKSAISQTVSEVLQRGNRLGGSFFFFRGSEDRSKMTGRFVATLASQLVAAVPETIPFIDAALLSQPQLLQTSTSLAVQLHSLVLSPFKAVWSSASLSSPHLPQSQLPLVIVVDGLDECERDNVQVTVFINSILDFFRENPLVPLRFFIASRIEPHVARLIPYDELIYTDLGSSGSDKDIDFFFRASFKREIQRSRVVQAYIKDNGYEPWPSPKHFLSLSNHAKGSFILAAYMVQYVFDGSRKDGLTPMKRLPNALRIYPALDELYSQTFSRSQHLPFFSDIISTLTLSTMPLSISAIAELLSVESFDVLHVLATLQAIMQVPVTDQAPITLCHASLRDFLRDERRSGPLFVAPTHHLLLSYRCFVQLVKPSSYGPLSNGGNTPAMAYSIKNCVLHWLSFLRERGDRVIEDEFMVYKTHVQRASSIIDIKFPGVFPRDPRVFDDSGSDQGDESCWTPISILSALEALVPQCQGIPSEDGTRRSFEFCVTLDPLPTILEVYDDD